MPQGPWNRFVQSGAEGYRVQATEEEAMQVKVLPDKLGA